MYESMGTTPSDVIIKDASNDHYCSECKYSKIRGLEEGSHFQCYNDELINILNLNIFTHSKVQGVTQRLLVSCRVLGARKTIVIEKPLYAGKRDKYNRVCQ